MIRLFGDPAHPESSRVLSSIITSSSPPTSFLIDNMTESYLSSSFPLSFATLLFSVPQPMKSWCLRHPAIINRIVYDPSQIKLIGKVRACILCVFICQYDGGMIRLEAPVNSSNTVRYNNLTHY